MAYSHYRHQVLRSYSNLYEIEVYLAFIVLLILKPVLPVLVGVYWVLWAQLDLFRNDADKNQIM